MIRPYRPREYDIAARICIHYNEEFNKGKKKDYKKKQEKKKDFNL